MLVMIYTTLIMDPFLVASQIDEKKKILILYQRRYPE